MSVFTSSATVLTNSKTIHYCTSVGSAGTSTAPITSAISITTTPEVNDLSSGSQSEGHLGETELAHDVSENSAQATEGVSTTESNQGKNETSTIKNKFEPTPVVASVPPTSLPYCFVSDETLQEEMARLEGLRTTNPAYAQELMKLAVKIVEAAKVGDVETLVSLLFFGVREGEVLKWAVGQAFCEACKRGHFRVVEMFCSHGLQPASFGLTEAMHEALQVAEVEIGGHVQVLMFLITNTELDVNHMRKSDSKTLLHLACARGFARCAKALLLLGADLNAVADDDSTPLGLLLSARETTATEQDAERAEQAAAHQCTSMSAVTMKELDTLAMAMSRLGARRTAF